MKKAIAYFFTMLMILFVASVFLISCKSKQQQPDVNIEVSKEKDSSSHTKNTEINKAIMDKWLLYIGQIKTAKPECDSITQAALENVLRSMNVNKQSGDNSYQFKYNQLLKRLELIIKIGATKNEITKDFKIKETFNDRFITKTITLKERLPNWQLYLMIIGSAAIVFVLFKLVLLVRKFLPA